MKTLKKTYVIMVAILLVMMFAACSEKAPQSPQTAPEQPEAAVDPSQPVEQASPTVTPQAPVASDEPFQPTEEVAGTEAPATEAETVDIIGTVKQEADDIVVSTINGDFIVADQDLTNMMGKIVKVTGTLKETNEKYRVIEATSIVEVQ